MIAYKENVSIEGDEWKIWKVFITLLSSFIFPWELRALNFPSRFRNLKMDLHVAYFKTPFQTAIFHAKHIHMRLSHRYVFISIDTLTDEIIDNKFS